VSSYLRVGQDLKGHKISADLAGSALDAAVRATFDLSWGRARELIRRGKVSLDGQTMTNPVKRVREGQELVLDLAARKTRTDELPAGALVHVDSHIVVVEKPSGMNTVPYDPEGMGASIAKRAEKASGEDAALDERVRAALARKEHQKGVAPSLGIVHRIDKETSGLLVFTRTWAAKKELTQAFRAHAVHRRYLAIVHGEAESTTFRTHLVPDRGDGLRGSVEHRRGRKKAVGSERTQEAITHIEVIERLPGRAARQPCTLVACKLETGRTHQIRIHLAESGHPLVGERVYIREWQGPLVPAPRLMLHAAELGFVHPATERESLWKSEPPPDMQEVLAFLRR
jgi:23S rRNA pseudouridine1911/1915/1917 synthase